MNNTQLLSCVSSRFDSHYNNVTNERFDTYNAMTLRQRCNDIAIIDVNIFDDYHTFIIVYLRNDDIVMMCHVDDIERTTSIIRDDIDDDIDYKIVIQ